MRDPQMTGYTPNQTPGVTPDDVIMVETRAPACDGGGGTLGHPRIYLRMELGQVTCPYCSRTYRLKEGAGDDGHH
ncbi:MAG: hypothetical protein JWR10_2841 [Rubritepida sp.]|nr:hypothetical protein [Rubritepida sp.]